jgi:hypothetical protein
VVYATSNVTNVIANTGFHNWAGLGSQAENDPNLRKRAIEFDAR